MEKNLIKEIMLKFIFQEYRIWSNIRTHTREKLYPSNQCIKSFSESGNLTLHLRTHSGEKPYQCSQCSKSFSEGGILNLHLRTHTGEKLYTCNQCTKSFSESGSGVDQLSDFP